MIIIFSRNTLYSLIYLNTRFSFVFLILFSIPLFIKYIKLFLNKSHNKRHLNLMIIFISILLILIALKRDFALLNFSIIISILIAFVFSQMYTYDKFCKHFLTIMAILCMTSLFNLYVLKPILIIGNVFLDLPSTYLYVKNYVGTEFINLITSFIIYDASYIRNFSIFTEPSYFQFYIIVSILLSYFNLRGKIKVFSLILFISTLISTFSTAGYIAFILVFLIFIIDLIKNICVNKENTRKKILKIFIPSFIVIVAIIFFMLSSDYLNETFYGVINKLFNRNDSSNTRYGGVFETIILFFKYPITGVTVNALSEREIMVNTLPTMFGLYGIFGGIIIIYYTKILCKKIGDSKLKQILIFIIILLSSNSHIYIAIPSFWMILFLGIMRKDVSHENIMDS